MATSDPTASLGEIIRRQRELSSLSMRRFAELAGISNPYLSQIERGLREPSEKVVEAIARSLETSADALYAQAGIELDAEATDGVGVRAAVEADPDLSPRQRRTLLEVYDALVAANGGTRRRRRARRPEADGADEADGPDPTDSADPVDDPA